MTSGWHLDADLATAYAAGRTTPVLAASVEQHVMACAQCRAALAPAVEAPRLDRVWGEVLEQVQAPPSGLLERLLRRLGLSECTARLIALTPSLRGGWLTGVVVVLALALTAAHSGRHGIAVFLALAPLLPMAGGAVAFGRATDPAYDVVDAAPYDAFRLLAVRAAAVVATTLALAIPAALLLPGSWWVSVGWLLPALALAVATLALAPRVQPVVTAGALTALWLAVALPGLLRRHDPLLAASSTVQLVSLLALAAGVSLLVGRQHALPAPSRRIS
jgi:hypothetical protein